MYPVDLPTFNARLARWHRMPDRRVTIDGNVKEWWAVGVCRLRRVRKGDWMELYADKGMPGHIPKHSPGKISFTTWDDWKPPVRIVPAAPEVPDWAE